MQPSQGAVQPRGSPMLSVRPGPTHPVLLQPYGYGAPSQAPPPPPQVVQVSSAQLRGPGQPVYAARYRPPPQQTVTIPSYDARYYAVVPSEDQSWQPMESQARRPSMDSGYPLQGPSVEHQPRRPSMEMSYPLHQPTTSSAGLAAYEFAELDPYPAYPQEPQARNNGASIAVMGGPSPGPSREGTFKSMTGAPSYSMSPEQSYRTVRQVRPAQFAPYHQSHSAAAPAARATVVVKATSAPGLPDSARTSLKQSQTASTASRVKASLKSSPNSSPTPSPARSPAHEHRPVHGTMEESMQQALLQPLLPTHAPRAAYAGRVGGASAVVKPAGTGVRAYSPRPLLSSVSMAGGPPRMAAHPNSGHRVLGHPPNGTWSARSASPPGGASPISEGGRRLVAVPPRDDRMFGPGPSASGGSGGLYLQRASSAVGFAQGPTNTVAARPIYETATVSSAPRQPPSTGRSLLPSSSAPALHHHHHHIYNASAMGSSNLQHYQQPVRHHHQQQQLHPMYTQDGVQAQVGALAGVVNELVQEIQELRRERHAPSQHAGSGCTLQSLSATDDIGETPNIQKPSEAHHETQRGAEIQQQHHQQHQYYQQPQQQQHQQPSVPQEPPPQPQPQPPPPQAQSQRRELPDKVPEASFAQLTSTQTLQGSLEPSPSDESIRPPAQLQAVREEQEQQQQQQQQQHQQQQQQQQQPRQPQQEHAAQQQLAPPAVAKLAPEEFSMATADSSMSFQPTSSQGPSVTASTGGGGVYPLQDETEPSSPPSQATPAAPPSSPTPRPALTQIVGALKSKQQQSSLPCIKEQTPHSSGVHSSDNSPARRLRISDEVTLHTMQVEEDSPETSRNNSKEPAFPVEMATGSNGLRQRERGGGLAMGKISSKVMCHTVSTGVQEEEEDDSITPGAWPPEERHVAVRAALECLMDEMRREETKDLYDAEWGAAARQASDKGSLTWHRVSRELRRLQNSISGKGDDFVEHGVSMRRSEASSDEGAEDRKKPLKEVARELGSFRKFEDLLYELRKIQGDLGSHPSGRSQMAYDFGARTWKQLNKKLGVQGAIQALLKEVHTLEASASSDKEGDGESRGTLPQEMQDNRRSQSSGTVSAGGLMSMLASNYSEFAEGELSPKSKLMQVSPADSPRFHTET